jgi:hypothetical protein
MAKSKIYKDFVGLYTVCGGYISRPFFGTKFNEGDSVSTHHFSGSTRAGVTTVNKPTTHNFKKSGMYEVWSTTGINRTDYMKKEFKDEYEKLFGKSYSTFEEYITLMTEWYKNQSHWLAMMAEKRNLEFNP